jgi:hypothetical protein
MIAAGRMSAEDAAAQIAVFEALAAEWRWMETGEGAPADYALLPAITAALDASIATIAEIAMEDGGLSVELAAQAEWVIAMAWHLEPGRRTRAARAQTFLWRQLIAAEAREERGAMRPRLHPLACPCRTCRPAAGANPARFPVPAPCAAACSICAPPRGPSFPADRRLPMAFVDRLTLAPFECRCGTLHASPDGQFPVGWTVRGGHAWCEDCTRTSIPQRTLPGGRAPRRRAA